MKNLNQSVTHVPFGSTFLSLFSVCHWLEVVTEWVLILFLHGLLASLSLGYQVADVSCLSFFCFTGPHEHRSFFPQSFCICNFGIMGRGAGKGEAKMRAMSAGYICPVDSSW